MPYKIDLRQIQAPVKDRYRSDPQSALVTTGAASVSSELDDPRHCAVTPHGFESVVIHSGLHPAAGGSGDVACSGDILAAALAICEESTLRSVAANLGLELDTVNVDVKIHWDFPGTMGVDREVPVGATGITLKTRVKVKDGVDRQRAERLLAGGDELRHRGRTRHEPAGRRASVGVGRILYPRAFGRQQWNANVVTG